MSLLYPGQCLSHYVAEEGKKISTGITSPPPAACFWDSAPLFPVLLLISLQCFKYA